MHMLKKHFAKSGSYLLQISISLSLSPVKFWKLRTTSAQLHTVHMHVRAYAKARTTAPRNTGGTKTKTKKTRPPDQRTRPPVLKDWGRQPSQKEASIEYVSPGNETTSSKNEAAKELCCYRGVTKYKADRIWDHTNTDDWQTVREAW